MKNDWNDIKNQDMMEYMNYIISNLPLLDVLKKYGVEVQEIGLGNFSHRACCPFRTHKGGNEKTPSFNIDSANNSYFCFGCSSYGNIVSFVQKMMGVNYEYSPFKVDGGKTEALTRLAKMAGLIDYSGDLKEIKNLVIEQEPPKETIDKYVFNCNIDLRDHLLKLKGSKKYKKELEWVDKTFIKLDKYLDKIDKFDVDKAKEIYANLKEQIGKRINEKFI